MLENSFQPLAALYAATLADGTYICVIVPSEPAKFVPTVGGVVA